MVNYKSIWTTLNTNFFHLHNYLISNKILVSVFYILLEHLDLFTYSDFLLEAMDLWVFYVFACMDFRERKATYLRDILFIMSLSH